MFILDTNVVSELRKVRHGQANPNVARWADSMDVVNMYVSAITIHELEIGVLLAERRDPTQGGVLRVWLTDRVMPAFAGRILSVDMAVAQQSAKLHVLVTRPVRDGLIAGTALVHGMTVATWNVGDFAPMGVRLVDPWDQTSS